MIWKFFFLEQPIRQELLGKFDSVICVGVFFTNHVTNKAFYDLVALCKTGGLISFNYREDQDEANKFSEMCTEIENAGLWETVETKRYQKYDKCSESLSTSSWV